MYAWYVCIRNEKHTLSLIYHLLSLYLSHTYSFCTLTHSHSHALLSRLRHSLRSIAYRFIEKSNITKLDHVRGEHLHLERQTYTIRFIMRCKIFLPGPACVVLKRLVYAWARRSINIPSINPCINYLMLISIHVAVSLVATRPGTARRSKSVAWARLLAVSGVQPG